jgi:nucleotide-binding universal stress UspA family protein
LRRQEANCFLAGVAAKSACRDFPIEIELAEGRAYEQIRTWIRSHDVDLTVLSTHDADAPTGLSLGSTARKMIDGLDGSLLLVPSAGVAGKPSEKVNYQRILVPLDGSAHAESVLPLAKRLAIAHQSELILAHVVPIPEIMRIGPPNAADVALEEAVATRNAEIATDYLDGMRAQLADPNLRVRTCLRRRADPCIELLNIIDNEDVDLVILSAHGRTGATDRALGSVSAHLVTNVRVPVLLSRRRSIGVHEWARASTTRDRGVLREPSAHPA